MPCTEAVFNPHHSPTETLQALLWVEITCCYVFSVFCKNLQTSVGCMLIKDHSDYSDVRLIAKELHNHYENSIYAQTQSQEICAYVINLHIATWKGTLQAFLNHWESQWLLVDKTTPISNQIHKGILQNAIH